MSNCGQNFINTQCNYVNDISCKNKCDLKNLKQQYNQELQTYFKEYNTYLKLKYGSSSTKQQKNTADTVIKPKVIQLNNNLNNVLQQLKTKISNTQNTINTQEQTITSKNIDIQQKNILINNQLNLIKEKETELNSKHQMLVSGVEINKYKNNVTYLFIILIVLSIAIIAKILLKKK